MQKYMITIIEPDGMKAKFKVSAKDAEDARQKVIDMIPEKVFYKVDAEKVE